ncbi:MAG: hypothetical protein IPO09_02245 [Anaeromyxobacter sp.]|nr:hypothetical protein [Anaeromyxobacter sp.]MBL0277542.1 hypothetical protein [Anaeromyxobacter sp.]
MVTRTVGLDEYLSAGYFLSRLVDPVRPGHRAITLGHDHSPRRFFPESWALSWCKEPPERRVRDAQQFGIAGADLARVHAWADAAFGKAFGAWDVIFRIEDARTIARMFLSGAQGLELWGLGVRRSVLEGLQQGTEPPPQVPGYAPTGASGVHLTTELGQPLAPGGTPLGHEPLIAEVGCSFNSPASLHLNEAAVWNRLGIRPNEHGLIDSYDEALAGCREFASAEVAGPAPLSAWFPGLIVRYPLEPSV